jgi:hypothetical protein
MMKISSIAIAVLLLLAGCKKEDEIITPQPDFIPPIEEIKFANTNAFYFGFGMTGSYKFSTDVVNQYKVIIDKTNSVPTSHAIQTFKYTSDYLLDELIIDGEPTSGGHKVRFKFYYTAPFRLIRIDAFEGNVLSRTYTVTHEDNAAGRKISIAPYAAQNGAALDSFSHALQVNSQNEVTGIYERMRFTTGSSSVITDSFRVFYSGENVAAIRGYQTSVTAAERDSMRINYTFSRTSNENPVLVEYLEKLYGSDLFNMLRFLQHLRLGPFTTSTSMDFLILHAQRNTSETQYTYSADIYDNGVFGGTQGSSRLRENTLDAQNRLIQAKVHGSSPTNNYTWEIIYK